MKLKNRTYDWLMPIALAAGPLSTFIVAVMAAWGLPYLDQVTATLAALETLLGSMLVISRKLHKQAIKDEDADLALGEEELDVGEEALNGEDEDEDIEELEEEAGTL
jgi:hypothetical protein